MYIPRTQQEFDAMSREERFALKQLSTLLNLAASGQPMWPSDARRLRTLATQFGLTLQWRSEHILS